MLTYMVSNESAGGYPNRFMTTILSWERVSMKRTWSLCLITVLGEYCSTCLFFVPTFEENDWRFVLGFFLLTNIDWFTGNFGEFLIQLRYIIVLKLKIRKVSHVTIFCSDFVPRKCYAWGGFFIHSISDILTPRFWRKGLIPPKWYRYPELSC